MTVFVALFSLLGALLKWALSCFCVYVPLRWFSQRFPVAGTVFGVLSLLVWLAGLLFVSCLMGYDDGDSPNPPSYPFGLLGLMWGSWLLLMLVGAAVMRGASQKGWKWGRSFLFCTLYLALAYRAPNSFLFFQSGLGYAWTDFWSLAGFPISNQSWTHVSDFLGCLFPLGAPLAEMALRSFRRVWQSNESGSFA